MSRKSAGDRVTNKFVQTAHTHKADRAGVTGNIVVKLKDKKTMIDNLIITFECNGITHTLDVPTKDENLPYNLATVFTEIIKQSDANSEMVIDSLKDEFAYITNSWISVNDRLPEMDREVIAFDDEGRISFAHIVDPNIAKDYEGWNIPGVEYWMPFNNPLED